MCPRKAKQASPPRGVWPHGGRLPKLSQDDVEAAKAMLANPDIGVTQIARRLGVSPPTLYRYIPGAQTANFSGVAFEPRPIRIRELTHRFGG
jgi:transposase-like protein